MIRLNVIAEGTSEESFVRLVLAPYLGERGIYTVARAVETSRRKGVVTRGGMTDYGRAKRDILRWLKQDKGAHVTTMFDLYALPKDFPGYLEVQDQDPHSRASRLEKKFEEDVSDLRFVPYLQVHEFESLLFSDVEVIDRELTVEEQPSCLDQLKSIRDSFETPEHIDDGFETCPSRRLTKLFPRYQKVTDGIRVIEQIPVATLRTECNHFSAWLSRLEALNAPQG